MNRIAWSLGMGATLLLAQMSVAAVHLMQIEQVIGGVCGDPTLQAVQLRMRAANQRFVAGRKLVAYDADGQNPVGIITFPSNVSIGNLGSRILITSTGYAATFGPLTDFTMTNLIPPSYLRAGRLTFEESDGTIYWSLSWGGSGYTGSTMGDTTNDADGDFGPSFAAELTSHTTQALQFQGNASDMSISNATDYAVTAGDAVFFNNAGSSGTVTGCVFVDGFESGDTSAWSAVQGRMPGSIS